MGWDTLEPLLSYAYAGLYLLQTRNFSQERYRPVFSCDRLRILHKRLSCMQDCAQKRKNWSRGRRGRRLCSLVGARTSLTPSQPIRLVARKIQAKYIDGRLCEKIQDCGEKYKLRNFHTPAYTHACSCIFPRPVFFL